MSATYNDIVRRAKYLIQEFGLAKGAIALDSNGKKVPISSPDAVSFCIAGALCRAGLELECHPEQNSIFEPLASFLLVNGYVTPTKLSWHDTVITGAAIPLFNDDKETTEEDVIKVLDEFLAFNEEKACAEPILAA